MVLSAKMIRDSLYYICLYGTSSRSRHFALDYPLTATLNSHIVLPSTFNLQFTCAYLLSTLPTELGTNMMLGLQFH